MSEDSHALPFLKTHNLRLTWQGSILQQLGDITTTSNVHRHGALSSPILIAPSRLCTHQYPQIWTEAYLVGLDSSPVGGLHGPPRFQLGQQGSPRDTQLRAFVHKQLARDIRQLAYVTAGRRVLGPWPTSIIPSARLSRPGSPPTASPVEAPQSPCLT